MRRLPTVPVPLPFRLYYGWVIVGASAVMNVAMAPANPIIFSFFITPMMEDMGWSRGALSLALTFRLVASAVSAPLIGLVIDKFGPQWLGVCGGLVAGVCLIGLAFTQQLWLVYLIFAVSGGVGFGGGPGGNLLTTVPVAKWFVVKRGRAMAITSAGMVAGASTGILIAQWLIQTIGWRGAWVVFGSAVIVVVIPVSALFMRRFPEDLGLLPDGATEGPESMENSAAASDVATEVDWTVGEALRTPTLWLILGALALGGFALTGTLIHRVGYWEEVGMTPALVAIGTAADPFTVIFSVLVFGIIGERVRVRYLGMLAGGGFALSMLPMIFTTGQTYTIFMHNIIWGGLGGGVFITFNNLIWPSYFGRKFLGTIRGITIPITIGATAFSAPIYGYLLDAGVAATTLWTVSLGVFATFGGLLLLARPPRRQPLLPQADWR